MVLVLSLINVLYHIDWFAVWWLTEHNKIKKIEVEKTHFQINREFVSLCCSLESVDLFGTENTVICKYELGRQGTPMYVILEKNNSVEFIHYRYTLWWVIS